MMETSSGAICTICGYASHYMAQVRRHLEGKHSIGRGYPCHICKIKCKIEATRVRHIRLVHKKTFSTAELRLIDENGTKDA